MTEVKQFGRRFSMGLNWTTKAIYELGGKCRLGLLVLLCGTTLILFANSGAAQEYKQQNLVSDLPGLAPAAWSQGL